MKRRDYEIEAMKRALALAARGRGAVEPNPMVGAVIVKRGRIIAEGYHRRFGAPHAEIEALEKAARRSRGAEMFVTLEPCRHHGKTPPCTEALIRAGIKRVVVAMRDPFEKMRGRGTRRLRKAGIRVETGLLAADARRLNAPYVKLRTKGLPFVIAKYAMTLDGNIAAASGDSKWVSCEQSRRRAHRLRGRMDAVVVGIGTVLKDDPLLTARPPGKRTPVRVVVDSRARLPLESRLVRTCAKVPLIVAATRRARARRIKALEAAGAEVVITGDEDTVDVARLSRELGKREMTNVMVEGGAAVLGSFFRARLVDEVAVFIAPKLAGAGIRPVGVWSVGKMSQALALENVTSTGSGCDVFLRGRVVYRD